MKLNVLVEYLNELFQIQNVEDDSLNGLQVENSGGIKKVGLAVDASAAAFEKARDLGVNFLFVHHGLFWAKPVALRGVVYRRIKILMESDIALYAVHLPLDLHPEFGNNAQIEKALGWTVTGEFGEYHGSVIGKEVQFESPVPVDVLADRLKARLPCEPVIWGFGGEMVRRLGYVSGGGLSMLQQAVEAGLDAYVTGEPGHTAYWVAKEAGINVIFAGHYATETLGVKAIGEHLHDKFGLETLFIDLPTGL